MPENPSDPSTTNVKRYAPPNQRNRVHNRRKSGDRIEKTNSPFGNDGEKNQFSATRNIPISDHGDVGSSNLLNESLQLALIPIVGCCNSGAAQLLNDRWATAIHLFNNPPLDLSEKPVMYSGAGASAWGQHSKPSHQMDFLAELRRAVGESNTR